MDPINYPPPSWSQKKSRGGLINRNTADMEILSRWKNQDIHGSYEWTFKSFDYAQRGEGA